MTVQLVKFNVNDSKINGSELSLQFKDGDIKIFKGGILYTLCNLIDNNIIYDIKKNTFLNEDCCLYFKSEMGNYSPMEIKYLLLMEQSDKVNKGLSKEMNKHGFEFKCIYSNTKFDFDKLMKEIVQFNQQNLIRKYAKKNDDTNLKILFEGISQINL